MKKTLLFIGLVILILNCSERENSSELKPLLIEQLKYSHTDENWFVPTKIAVAGLTAEQSNWKDSTENHSIGELVSHLTFWNEMFLKDINGEDFSDFDMDNEITFKIYSEKEWKNAITKLDSVQTEFERIFENANDKQISNRASDVLTMTAHNAYHTGQIIYIRKRNGWWNRK
ncbi:DinB family protein [Maribacter sp. 2307UL18-2]|uniref:DinB family protein n=1 Tax=Maribacter sp. 2307UL18-2 TaxID=3386274 RepID=UPI0039BC4725